MNEGRKEGMDGWKEKRLFVKEEVPQERKTRENLITRTTEAGNGLHKTKSRVERKEMIREE